MRQFMRVTVFCLISLLAATPVAADEPISFGVVPQQAASKLARLWVPLLDRVAQQSGTSIEFRTAKDIPTFEAELARGGYDCAYMNPYHFTVFNVKPGYQALVHARDKKIKGILVVRKDSSVEDIMALDGAELAFPAPAAFAATILPSKELELRGIDVKPNYVSSHDSVYRSVARGLFVAGGGVIRTFKNAAPEITSELRILWTTEGYTPHAIACAPDVPEQIRQKLKDALVSLDQDDSGRELVQAIKIKGFVAATNRDWDDVRALGIDNLSPTAPAIQ